MYGVAANIPFRAAPLAPAAASAPTDIPTAKHRSTNTSIRLTPDTSTQHSYQPRYTATPRAPGARAPRTPTPPIGDDPAVRRLGSTRRAARFREPLRVGC